jgi:hypothetical protein
MAILLVIGVMDLRAMAVVAAAITVERLAPAGERVAIVGCGNIARKSYADADTLGPARESSWVRSRSSCRLVGGRLSTTKR